MLIISNRPSAYSSPITAIQLQKSDSPAVAFSVSIVDFVQCSVRLL